MDFFNDDFYDDDNHDDLENETKKKRKWREIEELKDKQRLERELKHLNLDEFDD